MRVAVSSSGKDLDSEIDPRFGRCAYFVICDTDNMKYEAFENESALLGGGAGIQSAQFIASKGAEAVITGNCGPNADRTLGAAGIKMFVGQSGTVREAVERIKNNQLEAAAGANVPDHFGIKGGGDISFRQGFVNAGPSQFSTRGPGMGRGMGMGGGRGMGRGMGMGGGRGMGRGMGMGGGRGMGRAMDMGLGPGKTGGKVPEEYPQRNISKDQELDLLKKQSSELLHQMEEIQEKIKSLEKDNSE
jgi:predicted Fe-Mo cluster-binding NifX family protein